MSIVEDDVELYRRHADELTRYATALVGPAHAPDVVTDAVLAAFRAPGWAKVADRRAYLFRAVLNTARSLHRSEDRRRRRERQVAARTSGTAAAPEVSLDAHRALDALSPQQRAIVYLTYWEDFSSERVAELLGVSKGAVHKQLARARHTLRKVLDGN